MKNFIILFSSVLFFASCASSEKALKHGDYNSAIELAYKKLLRNPENQEEIANIELAYNIAQEADLRQIAFLKKEGNPQNYDQIYNLYMTIRRRQTRVKSLPDLFLKNNNRKVVFNTIDVDDELIKSKQNAAAFSYAHAVQMLNNGTKEGARKSYYEFMQVKQYYQNYKDVDSLTRVARSKGMTYVILKVQNKSRLPSNAGIEDELMRISTKDLGDEWIRFDTHESNSFKYDYAVNLIIKNADVGIPSRSLTDYNENKVVPDGLDYQYDKEGNLVIDSAGHPIKVPKYKTIYCSVREVLEQQGAVVNALAEFVNLNHNQVLETQLLTAEHRYENRFAIVNGDLNAASEQTIALMRNAGALPPPPEVMINECMKVLKDQNLNTIRTHRDLFE
ncbi:MAG: hypothetical protein ABI723_17245 [Bacteroidia bacterium]